MRGALASAIQLLLSSNTVHLISGRLQLSSKCALISLSNPINGIISRSDCERAMYSASVVDNAISVCSLLVQTSGHLPYEIT